MFVLKWVRKIIFLLMMLLFLGTIGGAVYQFVQEKLDERHYPPPGKLVDVGGFRLHIYCIGQKSPTVILDSGSGMFSLDWTLVQPKIAKFARVCSYDRAGYGWSDGSPYRRTNTQMVKELDALLYSAGETPPYVYVGHSLGAINARVFAQEFPDKVVGLVLVDPPDEQRLLKMVPLPQDAESLLPNRQIMLLSTLLGVERLKLYWLARSENPLLMSKSEFPPQVVDAWLAKTSMMKRTRAWLDEIDADEESMVQFEEMMKEPVKNKRVIVISAGKMQPLEDLGYSKEWIDWGYRSHDVLVQLHKEMAEQAEWGKHIVAVDSDHLIPWRQPDIIVEAVREIVSKVNNASTKIHHQMS